MRQQRLKIAHIVSTYPPYRGGMGTVAREYTVRLRARGHDAHVFTLPQARNRADAAVHHIRALRIGNAAIAPSLLWRLRGFTLLHLHYPFFGGAEFVALRRLLFRDARLIVSYQMDARAPGLKGALFAAHARTLLPLIARTADRILVSSRDYARASALARLEGLLDRVEVHPLGVDVQWFRPGSEPALRATLGIASDETAVLFVGTLDTAHHFKGLPLLLEALARLRDLRWRLIVVGDGPRRAAFAQLARDRHLASRVVFAGAVDDESLPAYYRAADFHVLPSTSRAEAFGLVTLEAAASGIPSIVSRLPGVRTLVLDNESGLHVTPNDADDLQRALTLLIDNRQLRLALGARARRRSESEFSWDAGIDRLEHTYRRSFDRGGLVGA